MKALCFILRLATIMLICTLSLQANAGDRLRLRSGEIDLTNSSTDSTEAKSLLILPHFSATQEDEQEQVSFGKPAWVGTKEKRPSKKADGRKIQHFVVQMKEKLANEDFINFKSLKLEIIRYIPDDAVIVASTARTAQVLAKSSNRIRAISPYRPEWKLSPELGAPSVFSGDPKVVSLVSLFPDQDIKALAPFLKNSKVKLKATQTGGFLIESKRSMIQSLANVDAVEWIEPNPGIESDVFEPESSMSSPVASDEEVKAVREYLVDGRGIPSPSIGMVKAVLMHAFRDLFPSEVVRGSVDVAAAKSLAASLLVDERIGLGPNDVHLYPITLAKRTELSATLLYTDAPIAAAASNVLVNDLDLAIIDSNGKRFELADHMSTSEHLAVQLPAGHYRIEVRGANVPMIKQTYALIVSAAL